MRKILIVAGTRPEWVKLASVITELKNTKYEIIIVSSGQHIELANKVLKLFKIKPDYNFNIMENNQSLSSITKNLIKHLDKVIKLEKPDVIIVVGDTNTSFCSALCAFYHKIKLVHIEAGARSYNKYNAFPEEMNRRMIDTLADLNLCQTKGDVLKLRKENITNGHFVGNTSLDVTKMFKSTNPTKKQVLITMHRREDWGKPLEDACEAIKELANMYTDHTFLIARHPNPLVFNVVTNKLKDIDNIQLADNLSFDMFIKELSESKLVMTDSGGIIQESIVLRKPVINLRDKSEYEDLFDGKYLVSTGKNKDTIIKKARVLLDMKNPQCKIINDFGNGNSNKKIIEYIGKMI